MACPTITTIPKTECIGNSLVTINSNFNILRDAICDIQTGIAIGKDGVAIGTNIQGLNFVGNGVEVVPGSNQTANVIINKEFPIGVSKLEEQSLNSGGGRNNFFILRDGSLRVCGLNTWGELGVGIGDSVYSPRIAGFSPPLELDENIEKVYTQGFVTFIITTKGRLYGAGYNRDGQLGQNNNLLNYPFFKFINVLGENTLPIDFYFNPLPGYAAAVSDPVIQIATGSGSVSDFITVFALTQSGALYAWGDNSFGQTSIPKTVSRSTTEILVTPSRVFSTGGTITAVKSAGNNKRTTIYVKDSRGKVFACGRNQDGQAGVNINVTDLTTFQEVKGLPSNYTARNIYVGGNSDNISAWITLTDGSLWAAGLDNSGQVSGNLSRPKINWYRDAYQPYFAAVEGFNKDVEYVDDIVAHADTDATSCWALILDGDAYKLKAWGDNTFGQLGIGDYLGLAVPNFGVVNTWQPLENPYWPWLQVGARVLDVVVAGNGPRKTTLVLDTNNDLWASGYGVTGLLGRGQLDNSNVFVRVIYNKALGYPIQLRSTNNDSSYGNFLVLLNSGKVLAWGYDSDAAVVSRSGWYQWISRWYSYPYFTYDRTGSGQLGVDASPQITSIPSLVQIVV